MPTPSEPEHHLKEWEEKHCKGIRIKCLRNIMKVDHVLTQRYQELKKDKPDYHDYISSFKRIDDIAKILDCSERTARDYRDALIYFSTNDKMGQM